MSAARDRVLAASGVLFGAMWLVAAGAKIASPLAAWQFAVHAVPPGLPSKPVLAAVVGGEVLLGAAMCLRALRGLSWSLAGLLAMSATLLAIQAFDPSELLQCGCFGKLFGTPTIGGALVRNATLIAAHLALIVWARRRAAAATPPS